MTDIRLYRDGAAESLRRLAGVEHVGTAASGGAAVVAARRDDCDIVLLDMSMPGSQETARALVTARSHLKVVALGAQENGPQVVACAEAGVTGYVSREASLEELGEVLRATMRGEACCSGTVAAGLIRHIALQAKSRRSGEHRQLTRREQEVLRLLEGGLSNKEIARALDLQLSTVKNHVHNLLAKFGASGRAEVLGVLASHHSADVLAAGTDSSS
ncbi:MAG: response regulator transcription factor [Actinomycetota bacterium]|nr:response regulator transcription factor [Actinomycetota bacterium]